MTETDWLLAAVFILMAAGLGWWSGALRNPKRLSTEDLELQRDYLVQNRDTYLDPKNPRSIHSLYHSRLKKVEAELTKRSDASSVS